MGMNIPLSVLYSNGLRYWTSTIQALITGKLFLF